MTENSAVTREVFSRVAISETILIFCSLKGEFTGSPDCSNLQRIVTKVSTEKCLYFYEQLRFYHNNLIKDVHVVLDIRGKINCDVKTLEVVSIYRKHKKLFDTNLAYVIRMLLKNLSYSVTKFQTVRPLFL